MRKFLSLTLLCCGPAWAQIIPARNCMSNPMMDGCPAAEEARKTQEMLNKPKWWEEHPELLKTKVQGSSPNSAMPSDPAPTPRTVMPKPKPNPVADTDWKRPRLPKPLAANWPRWTFAPSDTDALIGMKSSAVGALLGADVGKQVDEAWVSIRSLPGQKTEAVLLLMGPGVEAIAGRLRSKGVTVCFLDQRTLLSGEWSAVNRALTLVVAGAPGPMSKRAAELWANNDLWLIAGRQSVNQLLPPNSDPSGLTGASLGVSLRDKGALNILFTGANPAQTELWASKLSQSPGELGLGDVSVERSVSGISVRGAFDPAQLPGGLKRQIADQFRPALDLPAPLAASASASGGSIVIQGLDDGPKTIPAQKP
jgi:hypothetical protein